MRRGGSEGAGQRRLPSSFQWGAATAKILIIDDHEVVREGLKRLLELEGRRDVFGDAATPAEALTLISQQHWDLVVPDISLGGSSGLELLRAIQKLRPRGSEIAEMLSLSDKTVSTYRGRILEKLQLKTTAELVRYALEHSLID